MPEAVALQQVASWPEELGVSEYGRTCAENDIDLSVLPHLADQHLKNLGVSRGHQLRMLHVIELLANAPAPRPSRAEGRSRASYQI